jgi:hypothetical protein
MLGMPRSVRSPPVATNPDPQIKLTTTKGVTRTLDDWTTMFHLSLVVLPARTEAASFVPIARRIFATIGDADVTAAYVVTGPESVADRLLGSQELDEVVFVDPELELVHSLGLERLPAFVHLLQNTTVLTATEGWDPAAWQRAVREVAASLAWTVPEVAAVGDPPRFEGWPVT